MNQSLRQKVRSRARARDNSQRSEHTSSHNGQMGWLVDPNERVVLVYHPNQLPDEIAGDALLPCIARVSLQLTVEQMFGWLKVGQ